VKLHDSSEKISASTTIFFGTRLMYPGSGPETRSAEIRVPRIVGNHTVNVTVYSPASAGPAYVVYNITRNDLGEQMQFAITAQTANPGPTTFYCDYIIIAKTS